LAIRLIADPHGCFEGLREEIDASDVLLVLGDVLDLIDWADISGILPDIVGRETLIHKLLSAFTSGPQAAVALRDELIAPDGDYSQELVRRIMEDYDRFVEALQEIGCRTYVIYGNGDVPDMLAAALQGEDNVSLMDGKVDINGITFGFVSGALYSPFQMPAEMDDDAYGKRLEELGKVDILCTHIPPSLEAATMDIVAGKPVLGSDRLLKYLEDNRPSYLYHGHVHQPAQRELIVGETRVINVAYYKRGRYIHTHDD
jgi:Icc-related predicted phosphoesterase